jgi:hypothetical protein
MITAQRESGLPVEYGLALRDVTRQAPDAADDVRHVLDGVNQVTDTTPSRFGTEGFDLSYLRFPLSAVCNGFAPTQEGVQKQPIPRRIVLFMTGMGLPNRPLRETTLASTYNLVFDEIAQARKKTSEGKPIGETEIVIVGSTTNAEAEVPNHLPEMLWDEKFTVHGRQLKALAEEVLPKTKVERSNTEITIVTFSMAAHKGKEGSEDIALRFPEVTGNINRRYISPPMPDNLVAGGNPLLYLRTYLVAGGFVGDTVAQKIISKLRKEAERTKQFLSDLPHIPGRKDSHQDSQFWTKLMGTIVDGANIFRVGPLLSQGIQRFPTTVEFNTEDLVSTSLKMRREARRSGSFERDGTLFVARRGGHKDQPRVDEWLDSIGYNA